MEYFENGSTPDYADFAPAHRGRKRGQMQAIRIGDYVGVRYDIKSQADRFEIYNVTVDPKETNNLAPQMNAFEQQMKAMVLQVRRPNGSAPRPYDGELVPAVAAKPVINGVEWKAYEGDYRWVPDFEILNAAVSGTEARPDLSKRMRNHMGMFFSGYLIVPRDGDYTFYLTTDTGAVFRIHDATVIDADFGYTGGTEVSGSMRLRKGLHPFRLYYLRRTKGYSVPEPSVEWTGHCEGKHSGPGILAIRRFKHRLQVMDAPDRKLNGELQTRHPPDRCSAAEMCAFPINCRSLLLTAADLRTVSRRWAEDRRGQ